MLMKLLQWGRVFVLLLLGSCSAQQEYPVAQDALKDVLLLDEVLVPESAYDALTPTLNSSTLAPERFDVVARNNTPKAFFLGLVDGMGINMVVHPDVKGRITLNLKSVTLEETLKAVRDIYGYQYQQTSYGYRISPKTLKNKVFQLNYLNVTRQGTSGMSVSGGSVLASSNNDDSGSSNTADSTTASKIETQAVTDFWSNLQQTVKMIIGSGKDRRVIVDAMAGLIMVRAFPNELASVQEFLERAELSLQKQVIIEAKILEVSLNDAFQAGIQWDSFGQGVGGTFASSSKDVSGQITSANIINPDNLAGIFSLNINTSDFTGVISMLQRQGEVQVLSSPRISTVNNQKAVIKVGTDEFFVTEVTNNVTTTGDSTTSVPEFGLTSFFSGIALDVTPQIGDDNEVILHVHPSVTEVEERTKIISLGGDTYNLPVAFSSIRETDSIIRAASGQVVVIGGLLQSKKSNTQANVPWLSRIPILGHLFKQSSKSTVKSELIILLQPTVIEPKTWNKEIKKIKDNFPHWQEKGE
jgi:MSHA biogenesis protein MshL